MATRPTTSQARLFAQLIAELEPEVVRAFMASVTDLQANVDWNSLLESLQRFDIGGAVSALNINEAAWTEYSAVVSSGYAKAGASTMAQVRAQGIAGIGVRFNMADPEAQAWIRTNAVERVVGFAEEQRVVARVAIESGFAAGAGPRTIAVDLVGRVVGGERVGGVLGLDGPRAERLEKVTTGMRTAEGVRSLVVVGQDGTPAVKYKVNKSTEDRILKAYRAGTEVPAEARLISERQYKNALLKQRADTVAETESSGAVMGARDSSWQQLAASQGLPADAVIKTWRHRRGASKDSRPEHMAMSGRFVVGLETPFVFPDGTRMRHAHDPAGGAKHNIKCGCDTEYRIDHSAGLT